MHKNFIHHKNRSVITVSGEDAHKFLQGIISNDAGKISDGNSIYAFILTPQGKYLFDIFISKEADKFYIEVFSTLKDELLKKLKMYKLRSKVEIEDVSKDFKVYSLLSDGLNQLNLDGFAYIDPRNDKMGFRAILFENPQGFVQVAEDEYTKLRIENNIPEGEYDLERDRSYPLQYRMIELHAVDFKKGCYVGQEVTARTQHRGVVRKTVYRVEGKGAAKSLIKGQEVKLGSIVIGKVLSTYENLGLALLEVEAEKENLSTETGHIKVFA